MFKFTDEKIKKIKKTSGDPWDRTYCTLSVDILRFYKIQLAISIFRVCYTFFLAVIWTGFVHFDIMLPKEEIKGRNTFLLTFIKIVNIASTVPVHMLFITLMYAQAYEWVSIKLVLDTHHENEENNTQDTSMLKKNE